jgi:hypothetical protein
MSGGGDEEINLTKSFSRKKKSNEPFFYFFVISRHDLKSFRDLNLNNFKIITANI